MEENRDLDGPVGNLEVLLGMARLLNELEVVEDRLHVRNRRRFVD